MISWITRVILSTPRRSTSARAPWLSAIIRFWIKVESLNRPPTLLTINSSFNSSSIAWSASAAVPGEDLGQVGHGLVEVVVDDLIVVAVGQGEFAPGIIQAATDGRLVVGPPGPEPGLQEVGTGRLD